MFFRFAPRRVRFYEDVYKAQIIDRIHKIEHLSNKKRKRFDVFEGNLQIKKAKNSLSAAWRWKKVNCWKRNVRWREKKKNTARIEKRVKRYSKRVTQSIPISISSKDVANHTAQLKDRLEEWHKTVQR